MRSTVQSASEAGASLLEHLWRFSYCLTGDENDAEFLVEIALRHSGGRFHDEQQSLMRALSALYQCWTGMSDKHSFRKEQSLKEGLFHQPNIVDSEESELSDAALRQLLILSDRERVAMLLTAGMGLDYEQASSILNVPVNTVLELIASARIAIGRIVLSAH